MEEIRMDYRLSLATVEYITFKDGRTFRLCYEKVTVPDRAADRIFVNPLWLKPKDVPRAWSSPGSLITRAA